MAEEKKAIATTFGLKAYVDKMISSGSIPHL